MSGSKEVLLGIDVGTTNVKAAAFDPTGKLLSLTSSRLPVIRPQANWEEYDPEALFTHTAQTVRSTLEKLGAQTHVAGVAVASMAETAIPVNSQGRILHNAVAWHDERSLVQAEYLREQLGAEKIYGITGLPPAYIFGLNKLLWFKQNAAEQFSQMACWLNVADYIAYRLSGAQVTDLSLASRLMALDLKTATWSSEILEHCSIPASCFAELGPSGQKIGLVHSEAAAATGLAKGTVVVTGGHDHPCGAFALGITKPGDVLDSMGTSESIFTVMNEPRLEPELAHTGYQQGFHVVENTSYVNGGLYTSGRCIEWIKDLLQIETESFYDILHNLATTASPGSEGVIFLPHLRMANTPVDDPNSRGAFLGLSVGTNRACIARAVLEGLAYEAQFAFDGLKTFFAIQPERVRAIGGGTRNPLLMRIKASLFGSAIDIFEMDEATALGAAMLAGLGSGVYGSVTEAVSSVRLVATPVQPENSFNSYYCNIYNQLYKQLYGELKTINHCIVRLQKDLDI